MKKLVQFNELVFNHTAYIEERPEITTEFKSSQATFANSHGDYSPKRKGARKVNAKQFDVTLMVDKNKFPCEDRENIEQFVLDNLHKIGRLWAVQGDVLLWALAETRAISEGYDEKRGYLSFNVTFYIPKGVWNIADPTATYFDDYELCDIAQCQEFLERDLCECCLCNIKLAPVKFCPPCHGEQLCQVPKNKLAETIGNCGNTKKISYSCDIQTETAKGYSEVGDNTAFIEFYGKTLYETEDVVVEICGTFTNLTIDFNGEKSRIEGTYTGETVINGGIVKNNCDYLAIPKFHGICSNTTDCANSDCGSNNPKIGTTGASGNIVNWTVKKGKNTILLTGFAKDEIQTIKVYVGGIAL